MLRGVSFASQRVNRTRCGDSRSGTISQFSSFLTMTHRERVVTRLCIAGAEDPVSQGQGGVPPEDLLAKLDRPIVAPCEICEDCEPYPPFRTLWVKLSCSVQIFDCLRNLADDHVVRD